MPTAEVRHVRRIVMRVDRAPPDQRRSIDDIEELGGNSLEINYALTSLIATADECDGRTIEPVPKIASIIENIDEHDIAESRPQIDRIEIVGKRQRTIGGHTLPMRKKETQAIPRQIVDRGFPSYRRRLISSV